MNPTPALSVYPAEPIPGPDGTVEWWAPPLNDAAAVVRLTAGEDIVVRGADRRANRNKARELMMAAYGGFEEDPAEGGRMSLPHFHPPNHLPEGIHAFFEALPKQAKRRR